VCLLADNTEEHVAQRIYGYAHENQKLQKSDEGTSQYAQAYTIRKENRIKKNYKIIQRLRQFATSVVLSFEISII